MGWTEKMKFNYLFKATPLLSTLLLIIFLSLNNQKEYTKLRILIWNTPSLTLGTYLAISTGSGFILSYLITTHIAKHYQETPKQSLKFKVNKIDEDISEVSDTASKISYANTLIERDIKDPSPTVNASFRIIGKKERRKSNFKNNDNTLYEESFDNEERYDDKNLKINTVKPNITDWNDDTYESW